MERDTAAQTSLCRSGCGFYGSSATDGLCSKCFKEALHRQQDTGSLNAVPVFVPSSDQHSQASTSSVSEIEQIAELRVSADSPVGDEQKAADGVAAAGSAALEDDQPQKAAETAHGAAETAPAAEGKKKKNRCAHCNKRLGLTGFDCRCGQQFCGVHRYSDMHACSFDYKKLGETEIQKNNPVIQGEKVAKI